MDLFRRFSISFMVVTFFLTVIVCVLITRIYESNAIEQAKSDLARFVQTEAGHELTEADFSSPRYGPEYDKVRKYLKELLNRPGVLLTVVFSPDGTVVWSDYPVLVGKSHAGDPNLSASLMGNVHAAIVSPHEESHPFPRKVKELMELYVPLRLASPSRVSGVIEIYQDMGPLRSSIFRANMMVSGVLLAGFAALYLLLFGMVRRGNLLIEQNREDLSRSREKIQTQRMELLKRIGACVLEESDLSVVLEEATRDVCHLLEVPRCTIRLFGSPDTVVEYCAPGFPSSCSIIPDSSRPPVSATICEEGRIHQGAYIGVPLKTQGDMIGVLFLDREKPHTWTKDEVSTAEAVARQIAVAVRHTRVFQEQKELSGRLLSLVNNVPGVMYRADRDWKVDFVGADIERLLGYSSEEITKGAFRWEDLVHPEDVEPVRRRIFESLRARDKVLRLEYRARRRDGSVLWIADRRQMIYDASGRMEYVDGLVLDITDRKKAEEALRLTQFAVDRAGDAAYWMGADGRLIYVNDKACQVLGYTREELLSMTIHEVNPAYPPEVWVAHWVDLRQRKSYTIESRHRAKDGRMIPVEVTVNYVEFDGREYNCAFARDITERVQSREESRLLQAQLLQSQKMEAVGNLAGGIAHDFNNLLTGILGYADLLKCKGDPGSDVVRVAEVIQEAAERASRLTAQLLGFARKGKNLTVPVDIRAMIDDVTVLLERTLDKSIRIRKSFAANPAAVAGDPTQLAQIVMNLAMNSRDAMPSGGELTFSTDIVTLDEAFCSSHAGSSPGRYVLIAVTDTGEGIAEEHLGKIFDPFFTTKPRGKGTGLGLSMVFGIVKNHGGYIEAKSAIGAGTTFNVYLPVAFGTVETVGPAHVPVRGEECPAGKGRVLLIDDEDAVRDVASEMLSMLGYQVTTARDGREGVECYRRLGGDIDLVIIDMVMPNLGGRDCFREIKAMNPKVVAILSTGFSMDGTVQEIMDEGIAAFIQKPYRMAQLSKTLTMALSRNAA